MKAMIFAAGFGTRLRPLTDDIPKALVPILGKPLLDYVVERLIDAGVTEIVVNVHHYGEQIIDYIRQKDNFGIKFEISDERNQLLDTGGGLKAVEPFFNDAAFLVHNVDIFSNIDLKALYSSHVSDSERLATLVVNQRETTRYMLFDDNNRLKAWTNLDTGETRPQLGMDIRGLKPLAFSGIQVVSPKIFELMQSEKSKFPIVDFYLKHAKSQRIIGYVPENFKILDVGKLDAIDAAEAYFRK